eukprot:9083310-Pyramimonas_sp.AAC.1
MAGLARTAMQGGATDWEGEHAHSMSTQHVLDFWELTGSRVELHVRRLRLCQSWAADPEGASQ